MEVQVLLAALLGTALALSIDRLRRRSATFAAGFLGYRGEERWPAGVQEQYDVAWRVRPTVHPASDDDAWPPPGELTVARASPSVRRRW